MTIFLLLAATALIVSDYEEYAQAKAGLDRRPETSPNTERRAKLRQIARKGMRLHHDAGMDLDRAMEIAWTLRG